MKKRFSEEQIVKMIQEHKQGKSVSEISLEYGKMSAKNRTEKRGRIKV